MGGMLSDQIGRTAFKTNRSNFIRNNISNIFRYIISNKILPIIYNNGLKSLNNTA